MVASASSSNRKCPSACCCASSACVAESIWESSSLITPSWRNHWRNHWRRRQRPIGGEEFGGAVARANRTFDGRGQAGICPIAGQQEIAPLRLHTRAFFILRRGCGGSGAVFAHELPGRQSSR